MSRKNVNWQVALMLCIFILVAINMLITVKLFLNSQESRVFSKTREPLPCKAVPTRFVIEEPDCANKLLKSMNVTNVRILSTEESDDLWNKTAPWLRTNRKK